MKRLTYLAFIAAAAFALLMFFIKLNVIPTMKNSLASANAQSILIVDAGHGGEDGGAVAADGTEEAVLNLQISRKIELISSLFGTDVIMTRESDEIEYPKSANTVKARKTADQKARLALINSFPNAVLISVHHNKYSSGGPSGAQIFFAKTNGSRELAETAQRLFSMLPMGASSRVAMAADERIYLMKHVECTAILAECGFVSNSAELELLKSESHQKNIAAILSAAYLSNRFSLEAG